MPHMNFKKYMILQLLDVKLFRLAKDTVHIFVFFDILSELLDNGEKFLEVYNVPKVSQEEIKSFITTNIAS